MANNFVAVSFDPSGLNAALDRIVAASDKALRPTAQAGAQVLYDRARANAPVSTEAHIFQGSSYAGDKGKKRKRGNPSGKGKAGQGYLFYPGNLRDSVYQKFSPDRSNEHTAMYHIAWNHKKAPYGFMVEFGTTHLHRRFLGKDGRWYTTKEKLKTPKVKLGKAFLRGAWDTERTEAMEAMRRTYREAMKEVMT